VSSTVATVNVDAFVAAHQQVWQQLGEHTVKARKLSRTTPGDLERLAHYYERTGAHLAHARVAYADDDDLINRLTLLVGDAHGVLYNQRDVEVGRSLRQFVTITFPLAIWNIRRFIYIATLLVVVPWAVFQIWLAISPTAFDVSAPDAVKEAYIEADFEDYYSSQPAENFATQVFLNNVRVAFLAYAAGALLCVVTASLLAYNGANVGMAGGLFTNVGQWERFWGLILPHGMIEISAVIVAGAAGLRVGWTVISPGDRPRFEAFTDEARRSGTVVIGLIIAFLIAAIIEGFVTGRPWATWVRITIGTVALVGFWGTTIAFAIRARRAGLDA
jgi:uncharacterized membrane protein SpoIIM required for sporulation